MKANVHFLKRGDLLLHMPAIFIQRGKSADPTVKLSEGFGLILMPAVAANEHVGNAVLHQDDSINSLSLPLGASGSLSCSAPFLSVTIMK